MHYFEIDDLKMAMDADYLIQVSDDNGDGQADDGVMEWARDRAEDFVKSRVEVRYDLSQWDIDTNADEISDNVPGILVDCSIAVAVYKLASRRSEIPQSIIDNYNEAKMVLEMIAGGQRLLAADSSASNRKISSNMTEDDLGELTQDGVALQWGDIL